MHRSRKFQVATVIAGLALWGTAAVGETLLKTHPGLECVELYDTAPETYYSGGSAYNDATWANSYACPAPNTYLETETGHLFDDMFWWAYVSDQSATGDVSCYMRSCTQDGSSCVFGPTQTTSGTGVQLLTTVGIVLGPRAYTDNVTLYCSVPGKDGVARSGILNYVSFEF